MRNTFEKTLAMKVKVILLAILLCLIKQEIGLGQCWSLVSSSFTHSLALRSDGSLWGWGSSGDLGIGLPPIPNYNTPIQIGTETDWAKVAAGGNFSLAIKNDGSLWTWGSYANPILGGNNNTNLTAYNPVQIGNEYDWMEISVGGQHALALKSDSTLWAWGLSNLGQVGNGLSTCTFCPPVYQPIPEQIGNENDWKQISACSDVSLAIKHNGTLWCWGNNTSNLVNNGLPLNNTPVQIGTDTTWSQVECGEYLHALALKTDGTIWTWGYDITTDTPFVVIPVPTQVGGDNDWNLISAGADHDLAIKNNGTVWSWGRNSNGEMGNGSTSTVQPIPQSTLPAVNSNFLKISGGYNYSMGIKSDGTLWGWGSNGSGNLGIGNNLNQTTPQHVNCSTLNTNEIQIDPNISVYPNPTTGNVYLTIDEKHLGSDFHIYNALGAIVASGTAVSQQTVIETNKLDEGIYLLQLVGDTSQTVRFVKN